jgi:hypothetical protein
MVGKPTLRPAGELRNAPQMSTRAGVARLDDYRQTEQSVQQGFFFSHDRLLGSIALNE